MRGARSAGGHGLAQAAGDGEGGFAGGAGNCDEGGRSEGTITQQDTVAAVAEVEPEGDAGGIGLPEGEGGRAGFDAEAEGEAVTVQHGVPGEDALGLQVLPGEIAVAALPRVAEGEGVWRECVVPAEVEAVDGLGWSFKDERGWGVVQGEAEVCGGPGVALAGEWLARRRGVARPGSDQVRLRERGELQRGMLSAGGLGESGGEAGSEGGRTLKEMPTGKAGGLAGHGGVLLLQLWFAVGEVGEEVIEGFGLGGVGEDGIT